MMCLIAAIPRARAGSFQTPEAPSSNSMCCADLECPARDAGEGGSHGFGPALKLP